MAIYDFVIVGGGAAGCTLAARLAKTASKPKVLLLELGGKNDGLSLRAPMTRWVHKLDPELNPFYKTVPQKDANGTVIDYDRGKGLGGSTVVNFCLYDIGPKDDFDEIARVLGDDDWKWSNAHRIFKELENFHEESVPEKVRKFVNPKSEDHGKNGALHFSYPEDYNDSTLYYMDLLERSGYKLNPDFNNGDPIGLGMPVMSFYNGWRTTAHDQLLDASENLTILTESPVNRVIFDQKTAIGVESKGKQYFASKEIILSAGSLDTPKILMHSGIGDSAELSKFNIPVVHHLPGVGHGLADHNHVCLVYQRNEDTTTTPAFWRDPSKMVKAQKQWEKDRTGPMSTLGATYGLGFFKLDRLEESEEFTALPEHRKRHLQQPTVPHYEITVNTPYAGHFISPSTAVAVCVVWIFMMNLESRGSLTINPAAPSFSSPLLFDPRVLSHSFDRHLFVSSIRSVLRTFVHAAPFAADTVGTIEAPEGGADASDAQILDYVKRNIGSTWHMTGTVKAGKVKVGGGEEREGEDVCVDPELRVNGVERLRVVDMSVYPIMPNNHTQSSAYLVGALAAEKLVREYGL